MNNVGVLLILILGGLLLFSIPTVITLFINGFIVGIAFYSSIRNTSLILSTVALLPHGVFEVMGFLIAAQIGFELSHIIIDIVSDNRLEQDDSGSQDSEDFIHFDALIKRTLLSLSLVFIGAVIETTLSPYLIEVFL